METISLREKSDILLTLALAFEKKFSAAADDERTAAEVIEKSFGSMRGDHLAAMRERAELYDEMPENEREIRQKILLDKMRRRGRGFRLDENINPAHIVEVLSREPENIQQLILKNLPADLSRRIAAYFDINAAETTPATDGAVSEEIVALIKRQFLAHFVAFEDVYEPREIDGLTVAELAEFIRHLSLREVAIACRGINSKESLAAFVNRFEAADAREIAQYIMQLEKVKPYWVAEADALVRQLWDAEGDTGYFLKKIGLKLLAAAFAGRDETARRYARLKLSERDARRWRKLCAESDKAAAKSEEEASRIERRRKITERLAAKFTQTGKL